MSDALRKLKNTQFSTTATKIQVRSLEKFQNLCGSI